MITRRRSLAALTALAGVSFTARSARAADDMGVRIDEIIKDKMASEPIPGAAFLAVRDGKVVHTAAFGQRDREQGLAVTLDTLFPIGSATKAFTSMAAGVMQDKGWLSFDDRPHTYLPDFHMHDPYANARVTLRDMLSHRTGLRAYADLAAEPGVLTRDEYVRAAVSARPEAPFHSRFQYSNAMVVAAGQVLAHIGRASWEDVITQEVLRPLGMTTARATLLGLGTTPDHATGYVHDAQKGTWTAVPPPRSLDALAPAGAVATSANDLSKWLFALTSRGRPLVRSATFAEITTPQIALNPAVSYALCWATYDWNGMKVVEHNGGSEGISALVSFLPDQRTGFVFLANTSPNSMTKVTNAAALIYPHLLGLSRPVTPLAVTSAPEPAAKDERPKPDMPRIDVDTVLTNMIAAAGGEDVLKRHRTLQATGDKSYENQGVQAAFTLKAAAPAAFEETEIWTAAGREIGRLRSYFNSEKDGDEKGGQETTFGQDAINDAETNARTRRDRDFQPLLRLRQLYKAVAIKGTDWIGDRAVIVLAATADDDSETLLSVAMDDFHLAARDSGGTRTIYSDYRSVDGEAVAWHWEIHDGLGLTSVQWREIVFNATVDPADFAARKIG